MSLPVREPLSAEVSTVDTSRPGKGPLGALPALSSAARRALALTALLAALNAAALVAQAFLLADVLAGIVGGTVHTRALAVIAGLVVARSFAGWATRVVAARAAAGAKEELRAKAVDHALRLGPERLARLGPAELTTLTTRGLDALDSYFADYLPALVTAAVVPVTAGAAVLVADWPSALIIAATVPLLPMFAILVGKYTADRVSAATDAVHRMAGHLLELVRALPVLTAFRRAEAQADAVRRVSDRHRRATLGTLRVAFASALVLELAATLSVALVAVVIGVRLVSGDLTLAVGLGVLILAPECYQPLRNVGAAFHASEDGVEAVRRVSDLLAEEPLRPTGDKTARAGELRVDALRVRRRDRLAPDGETFTVRPGELHRLRSPSGSGKTTTLSVLLGFTRPSSGSVTVGGVPLDELDMSTWRQSVAWVPQQPVFTGGTVRDELAPAAPENIGDPSDVLTELALDGLADTPVDTLSEGQRQRVAVARALLRVRAGAWLLLLDEPTAHLDAANADRVMAAVRAAAHAGAAVVVAAHDRDALDTADQPPTPHPARPGDARTGRPLALRTLLDRRMLAGAALGAAALLAGAALTATSGWLIAKASQQPPILTLTVAVVGVRAFGLARAGLRYAERLVTHDAAFRIAAGLRERLWRTLVRLGPARTLDLRHGEGQRRLVGDVDTVRDLLPRVVPPPLVAAVVLGGACVAQALVLPEAGLVLAVSMALAAVLAPALALATSRRASTRLAAGRRDVEQRVLGLFGAAAELIAYGVADRRRAELAATDDDLAAESRKQAFGAGIADAVVVLATGLAAVGSTALAANAVAGGTLDPTLAPLLALVPLALGEVLALLPPAAQHWDTLGAARIRLATPATAETHVGPQRTDDGRITLHGADVRWPGSEEPVLHDVDLDIPQGSHVAVVGPSGAGKSTLVATLLGFLTPERGDAAVPARVAWVPQDAQLVATTVAENLRLADPHATDDDLRDALRAAGLPDLDPATLLGSAGTGLSGGQAQRVALARALLAARGTDADTVVLLDEPTAHLDAATADAVLANLHTLLAGHTVVHVTHRPEEAAGADLVVELTGGRATTRAGQGHSGEPGHRGRG